MTAKYPANRPLTDKEEAEIQAMIADDPDAPEVTDEQIARAQPFSKACPELYAGLSRRSAGGRKWRLPKKC